MRNWADNREQITDTMLVTTHLLSLRLRFPIPHSSHRHRPLTSTMCPAISDDAGDQKGNGSVHSYEEAICSLNRLQSNASVIELAKRVRASDPSRNLTHTRHYLSLMGITDKELADLKAIHVAGTKGKGSTCAFTESILCKYVSDVVRDQSLPPISTAATQLRCTDGTVLVSPSD